MPLAGNGNTAEQALQGLINQLQIIASPGRLVLSLRSRTCKTIGNIKLKAISICTMGNQASAKPISALQDAEHGGSLVCSSRAPLTIFCSPLEAILGVCFLSLITCGLSTLRPLFKVVLSILLGGGGKQGAGLWTSEEPYWIITGVKQVSFNYHHWLPYASPGICLVPFESHLQSSTVHFVWEIHDWIAQCFLGSLGNEM